MHLKQLKIAGFKSFIDPVVIPFFSHLVAVVGPNGCGKSNIVDAVRWVMGESSAKNLRGDSMTDVICNGSSQRKPLGQAVVELVFDNSMGRLGGPYGSYQEIAIKRVVTRDGDSAYFLNGARCRRIDVLDVFLGTGAGPRSYSMITQGTIAKLIEAKPDELRMYLEEAAGVSKYKERRRETKLRIESTKENLHRVEDVSLELNKQLLRLSHQAESAKQYTHYKQQEMQCRQRILTLKWQDLSEQQTARLHEVAQWTSQLEDYQAVMAVAANALAKLKQDISHAQDDLSRLQTAYYQVAIEIARLQEVRTQRAQEQARCLLEQQSLELAHDQLSKNIEQDKQILQKTQSDLKENQQLYAQLQHEFTIQEKMYQDMVEQDFFYQKKIQDDRVVLGQITQAIAVEQLQVQHGYQQVQTSKHKIANHQASLAGYDVEAWQQALAELRKKQYILHQQATTDQMTIATQKTEASSLRQQWLQAEKIWQEMDDALRGKETEHAVLLAKYKSSSPLLDQAEEQLLRWQSYARLHEHLTVVNAWQAMVECILDKKMQAIVVNSLADEVMPHILDIKTTFTLFVEQKADTHSPKISYADSTMVRPRLLDMVSGASLHTCLMLQDIFAAADLQQACAWLDGLLPHQSVATCDGFWLGPGWLMIANQGMQHVGNLFAQKEALQHLTEELASMRLYKLQQQQLRDDCHRQLFSHEQRQDALQKTILDHEHERKKIDVEVLQCQQKLEQAQQQVASLQQFIAEEMIVLEDNTAASIAASQVLEDLMQQKKVQEEVMAECIQAYEVRQKTIAAAQLVVDSQQKTLNAHEIAQLKYQLQIEQLNENVQKNTAQLDVITAKKVLVSAQLDGLLDPDHDTLVGLEEKSKSQNLIQTEQANAQQRLEQLNLLTVEHEQSLRQNSQHIQQLQVSIQGAKIKEEAWRVQMSHLEESLSQISAANDEERPRLCQLQDDATTLAEYETQLLQLVASIKSLGAINLLAIEEYAALQQRKTYLDQHTQDLRAALTTLESAIHKMDLDTKTRFKDTFDEINILFQALFPRLFGGGSAKLVLTCDNLLEAGVMVEAKPPGKRNSTIQLLSGGEKAMTAVALVFAIFKLNPSPFCMLDEVDAPLDDNNVRLFCDLMKELSHNVQFLFITHNKVTMELAEQLIGVTMHEPGVSRVVAVDVAAAFSTPQ